MYVEYANWDGRELPKNACLLMSAWEFKNGGKDVTGAPITVTPRGEEPQEPENPSATGRGY